MRAFRRVLFPALGFPNKLTNPDFINGCKGNHSAAKQGSYKGETGTLTGFRRFIYGNPILISNFVV